MENIKTLDDLTEDQKRDVMELIIVTVKEIREQIAGDIEATIPLWKSKGLLKSRRTEKAFQISAAIARGQNEKL
jgi:ribosomal protein S17E